MLLYRSVDNLIAIPRIEYKSRTKRSMSINDDIHGSPEAIHIQRTGYPNDTGQIVSGSSRIKSVKKKKSLLGKR